MINADFESGWTRETHTGVEYGGGWLLHIDFVMQFSG